MKKSLIFFATVILLANIFSTAKAEGDKPWRIWREFVVGEGGNVPSRGTFGTGLEYAFFHDDYNHDVTVSAELIEDTTSYGASKMLLPILANYRWFTGPRQFQGMYFSAGLGEAIPFGADHGSGSFAWQGGVGYIFSDKVGLELRYLGRRSQTVVTSGTAYTLNNSYLTGMLDFSF